MIFKCPGNSRLLTSDRSFWAFEKNPEAIENSFFCAIYFPLVSDNADCPKKYFPDYQIGDTQVLNISL
jgi:hypothetical protein